MELPLFISVPHAGTKIPQEVQHLCILEQQEILADHDAQADAIYFTLEDFVAGFGTTDVAKSFIDLNRAPDRLGGDGVIKSHTSWNMPIYSRFPDESLIQILLDKYYFPYHERLSKIVSKPAIRLGLDCHTMSVTGPPVSPDPGRERPMICLSYGNGTCPREWLETLASCLSETFTHKVSINSPFQGGYIIRSHSAEKFWIQIEISQTEAHSVQFKKNCLLEGLRHFCHIMF